MNNKLLDLLDFDQFDYEVAFEYQESGFFKRLFSREKEHPVYYIRRVPIGGVPAEEEKVLSCTYYSHEDRTDWSFCSRTAAKWYIRFWDNPTDPENLLTRLHMKLKPTQDNVVFSTSSLKRNT